jgi:pimeloyl-ACP methyl ester carboxylesterase
MNRLALTNESIGPAPSPPQLVWDRLATINRPAMVVCGDLDLPHIQRRTRQLAELLPGGSYELLAGVAHLPQIERPEEISLRVAAAIRRADKPTET